jgi:hypothetical protein
VFFYDPPDFIDQNGPANDPDGEKSDKQKNRQHARGLPSEISLKQLHFS